MWVHPELSPISSLLGILVGGGIPYAVATLYWIIRKRAGLGMGDVKLLAGIGGWLGWQAIIPTLFSACLVGSFLGISLMIGKKQSLMSQELPFGPYLAFGALLYTYTGTHILALIFER